MLTMSCHQSYFATLMSSSGADQIIILNDDAAVASSPGSYRPLVRWQEDEKSSSTDQMERRHSPSFGPPCCPLRKASTENLVDNGYLQKKRNQERNKASSTLNKFYQDVVPAGYVKQRQQRRLSFDLDRKIQSTTLSLNHSWHDRKIKSCSRKGSSSCSPPASRCRSTLFEGKNKEDTATLSPHREDRPTSSCSTNQGRRKIKTKECGSTGPSPHVMKKVAKRRDTRWIARPEEVELGHSA